jgi:PAS domain S-box-containing protein
VVAHGPLFRLKGCDVLFEGLESEEENLRFIEELGKTGRWTLELSTMKMTWSTGFFALLGLPDQSVQPSYAALQQYVLPQDVRPPGEIETVLKRAGVFSHEFRVVHRGGRIKWLLSRGEVLVGRTGLPIRAVGILIDITEKQELKATAFALCQRFKALIEGLSIATWICTPVGDAIEVSAWAALTGMPSRDVLGHGWTQAIHPDDRQRCVARWQDAIARGEKYEEEHRIWIASGEYHWVLTRAHPVRGDAGEIVEWIGFTRDIHAEKLWRSKNEPCAITGAQLRAGRALLNWSVRDLSEHSQISAATIRRLEEMHFHFEDEPSIPNLRGTLERAGVEFLFPPLGHPGVRPATAA